MPPTIGIFLFYLFVTLTAKHRYKRIFKITKK